MYKIKPLIRLLVSMLIIIFFCTACVDKPMKKNMEMSAENTIEGTIEDSHDENYKDPNNPLNIIGMKVEWLNKYSDNDYDDYKLTLQTPDGDYKYSDEDAELYYDKYAVLFAIAANICDTQLRLYLNPKRENIRDYLKNNLFKTVCDIPLNDSYPQKVREVVNKVYYDNIDDIMHTLHLADRGYGYKVYEGYKITRLFSERYPGRLYVRRGNDSILYIKNNTY